MALARCAAVVFRNVNMDHVALDGLDGRNWILFLDVGMKGVIHRLDCRMINFVQIISKLRHRVEKVTFKTVQRFNSQSYILLCSMIAKCAMKTDAPLTLLFCRSMAREITNFRMHRSSQNLCPQSSAAIHCPLTPRQSRFALCCVRRQAVVTSAQHTNRRHLKAQVCNHRTKARIMR